jgi:hypothetical protein
MAVFRQRRGTAAALAAANETPAAGQIYFELDANRVKIGNGTTRYNDLPYLDAKTVSQIEGLQAALDQKTSDLESAIATIKGDVESSLDTLGELSDAINDDPQFFQTISTALGTKVDLTDARLTNSREWSSDTVPQAEAEAGTATTRRAWTAQRVFQAIAAWWNGSAAKAKLDGIATGATANATDAALRDRQTHTGEQAILTVTGLQSALDSKSNVGHTHALNDLSDVSASSSFDNPLLDNYILTYDQATGTWRHTNKGGYVPVGSIPLGGYPSGTIGAALAGKVNATDARLTDQRVPIDGSVTTNKLSDDNLTLDGGNF